MNRRIPVLALAMTALLLSCATTGEFKHTKEFIGSKADFQRSQDPIDNTETYEVYFTLDKPAACIHFSIIVKVFQDEFSQKERVIRSYYTIDRMLDISGYHSKEKLTFTLLGKNFTDQWETRRSQKVCRSQKNPTHIFIPQGVYRIRFYPNTASPFSVYIAAKSNSSIKIWKDYPAALQWVNKMKKTRKK
jgi:hypothetical protein